MKVILDTNVLLVAIGKHSKHRWLFDGFLNKRFNLLISNEILEEYAEIIANRADEFVSNSIISLLLNSENVTKVDIYFHWQLIVNDPDDNKFVDCAVSGVVDYLVTEDHHFNLLKSTEFPSIKVVSIAEFQEIFLQNQ